MMAGCGTSWWPGRRPDRARCGRSTTAARRWGRSRWSTRWPRRWPPGSSPRGRGGSGRPPGGLPGAARGRRARRPLPRPGADRGLLLGYAGRWGEPRSLGAAWARLAGLPVPADPPPRTRPVAQQALFEDEPAALPGGAAALDAAVAVHADQLRADRRRRAARPAAACWSPPSRPARWSPPRWAAPACRGGPTSTTRCCADLLGPPPPVGGPPRRLAELADRVNAAFGGAGVNPDSPAEVVQRLRPGRACTVARHPRVGAAAGRPPGGRAAAGVQGARTGSGRAHGWAWLRRRGCATAGSARSTWPAASSPAGGPPAAAARCRSRRWCAGRWSPTPAGASWSPTPASSSRGCWPRCPATPAWPRPAAAGDLYAALAADAFGGDRARAKVALLGAMYGADRRRRGPGAGGAAAALPDRLSSTSRRRPGPARRAGWSAPGWAAPARRRRPPGARRGCEPRRRGRRGRAPQGGATGRARGRFTRNFVIQATAAEWALVLLAALRTGAARRAGAELVFFQHDEVVRALPARRPARWSRPSLRPGRRGGAAGCCSATRRSGSRSRSRRGLLRRREIGGPGRRRAQLDGGLRQRWVRRDGLCRRRLALQLAARPPAGGSGRSPPGSGPRPPPRRSPPPPPGRQAPRSARSSVSLRQRRSASRTRAGTLGHRPRPPSLTGRPTRPRRAPPQPQLPSARSVTQSSQVAVHRADRRPQIAAGSCRPRGTAAARLPHAQTSPRHRPRATDRCRRAAPEGPGAGRGPSTSSPRS